MFRILNWGFATTTIVFMPSVAHSWPTGSPKSLPLHQATRTMSVVSHQFGESNQHLPLCCAGSRCGRLEGVITSFTGSSPGERTHEHPMFTAQESMRSCQTNAARQPNTLPSYSSRRLSRVCHRLAGTICSGRHRSDLRPQRLASVLRIQLRMAMSVA